MQINERFADLLSLINLVSPSNFVPHIYNYIKMPLIEVLHSFVHLDVRNQTVLQVNKFYT